jgi:hypothetical protein
VLHTANGIDAAETTIQTGLLAIQARQRQRLLDAKHRFNDVLRWFTGSLPALLRTEARRLSDEQERVLSRITRSGWLRALIWPSLNDLLHPRARSWFEQRQRELLQEAEFAADTAGMPDRERWREITARIDGRRWASQQMTEAWSQLAAEHQRALEDARIARDTAADEGRSVLADGIQRIRQGIVQSMHDHVPEIERIVKRLRSRGAVVEAEARKLGLEL